MSKLMLFSFVVVSLGFVANAANAQNNVIVGQGCGGAQTYQRYSYQPAVTPSASMTTNQAVVANSAQGSAVQSAPWVAQRQVMAQPQTYRRYSYQPSNRGAGYSSGTRKNIWEYAKGDPRRNRP